MIELENQAAEVKKTMAADVAGSQDGEEKSPRLTKGAAFLLVLTLIAIAVIIALALIGPLAGGEVGVFLSL
jgi:hypothetical protein